MMGVLLRSPLGEEVEAAFGAPYYTLYRRDLHRALADVNLADCLHLGHRFTQLLDHSDRIEVRFENGASVSQDALIGADGIHSVVRHALFGPEKPRFTGCVAHRGMVSADRLVHLGLELRNQIWMGPGKQFVHYFVSAGTLVNFVAITEKDSWLRESWIDRGEVSDVLAALRGWHHQVLSIIEAADETYKWALLTAALWLVGRLAGLRFWGTLAIRCCHSWSGRRSSYRGCRHTQGLPAIRTATADYCRKQPRTASTRSGLASNMRTGRPGTASTCPGAKQS
jgi:salicylate hydroxylase